MSGQTNIVILGLGNILCGDDGFGIHLLERLHEKFDFPPNVALVDGGTQGQALYCHVEEADYLLVLDAVDFGMAPGELAVKSGDDIPRLHDAKKLSAHQGSFLETLALAYLKGVAPLEIKLVGMQPQNMEFGSSPTPILQAKLDEAVNLCLDILRTWAINPILASHAKALLNSAILQSRFMPAS